MQTFAQGAGWLQPLALDEFDLVTLAGLETLRGNPATAARELQIDFIDRMLQAWLTAKAGQADSRVHHASRLNQSGFPANFESSIANTASTKLKKQIPRSIEEENAPVADHIRQSMYVVAQLASNKRINNSSQIQMLQLKDVENHIIRNYSIKRPPQQSYSRNVMTNSCLSLVTSSVGPDGLQSKCTKRTITDNSGLLQNSTCKHSQKRFHEPIRVSNLPKPYDLPCPPWHSTKDTKYRCDNPGSNSASLSTIPVTFDNETISEVNETCITHRVTRTIQTPSHTNRKCIFSDRKSNPFARRSTFDSKNNNYTNFKHI